MPCQRCRGLFLCLIIKADRCLWCQAPGAVIDQLHDLQIFIQYLERDVSTGCDLLIVEEYQLICFFIQIIIEWCDLISYRILQGSLWDSDARRQDALFISVVVQICRYADLYRALFQITAIMKFHLIFQ